MRIYFFTYNLYVHEKYGLVEICNVNLARSKSENNCR